MENPHNNLSVVSVVTRTKDENALALSLSLSLSNNDEDDDEDDEGGTVRVFVLRLCERAMCNLCSFFFEGLGGLHLAKRL